MKLLVDMNLSPSWVVWLARHGIEATHWSAVGPARAPDDEVLASAHAHGFLVLTHDLDVAAILAATAGRGPSVVQLRSQDLLSPETVSVVARALRIHREDIEQGALLSIDESGTRVRILPLRAPFDTP